MKTETAVLSAQTEEISYLFYNYLYLFDVLMQYKNLHRFKEIKDGLLLLVKKLPKDRRRILKFKKLLSDSYTLAKDSFLVTEDKKLIPIYLKLFISINEYLRLFENEKSFILGNNLYKSYIENILKYNDLFIKYKRGKITDIKLNEACNSVKGSLTCIISKLSMDLLGLIQKVNNNEGKIYLFSRALNNATESMLYTTRLPNYNNLLLLNSRAILLFYFTLSKEVMENVFYENI